MNIVVPQEFRIKNTIKFPTSLIIGGLNRLGFEIADSLIEQGGYVIIVDSVTPESIAAFDVFREKKLISFVDYTSIPHLSEDIRRLDYVFYFAHESIDYKNKVSTQNFLNFSNYLDASLSLASKYDAKFLLTTSLKAYQLHASEQQMIAMSGTMPATTVYTEMEVQRYAESLTQEYFEKAELDTRILRLGDIIGEGIDFAKKTVFNELVLAAAKADYLKLQNDGLENEWFVHVLDCAYALIKAQFSKATTGKIYSVSYDTTFTHLSIAYKIQEVEEQAKEIQFVEEKNTVPILRIHKPAPNLATIGWMPRVSFDRAVKQSIAAAKIYLVEHTLHKTTNIRDDNLNKFAGLVGNTADQSMQRIVSRRQQHDALRNSKIGRAAQDIRGQKVRRQRTVLERFQDFFWNRFISVARVFTFLQRKSPLEIAVIALFSGLALFIYFQFVSPALVIAKNVLIVAPTMQTIKNTNNFDELLYNYAKTQQSIEELELATNQFSGFSSLLNANTPYQKIQSSISEYKKTATSLSTLSFALQPLSQYLQNYKSNIQIRNSTDGYLSVVEPPLSYQTNLEELTTRNAFVTSSIASLQKSKESLDTKSYIGFPTFLLSAFNSVDTQLKDILQEAQTFESLAFTGNILGLTQPKTHLIVLLDNTQLKPLGGSIAGFALVTVDKGGITDIIVQPVEVLTNKQINLTTEELQTINMTRYSRVDAATVKIADLASISHLEDFAPIARNVWKQLYNNDIDGVAVLDLSALESLIKITSDNNILTLGNTNFGNNGGITANINTVVNSGALTRNQVISNLFAVLFYYHTSNIKNSFIPLGNTVQTLFENKQLRIEFADQQAQSYVLKTNLNDSSIREEEYYIRPSMDVANDAISPASAQFANFTITAVHQINNNNSIRMNANIKFPNYDAIQDISVCIPASNVLQNTIKIINLPETRVVLNENDQEYCAVGRIISEDQINFEFTYQIAPITEARDFRFGIQKVYGAFNTLQHAVSATEGLTISASNPNISNSDTSEIQYQINPMNGNIQEVTVASL